MQDSRFNRENFGEYRDYLMRLGEDNSISHGRLVKNLRRAIEEELTSRQMEMITRYYIDGRSMQDIADELSVNVSTVSRTIKRGRVRLSRCLRFGARELLDFSAEG